MHFAFCTRGSDELSDFEELITQRADEGLDLIFMNDQCIEWDKYLSQVEEAIALNNEISKVTLILSPQESSKRHSPFFIDQNKSSPEYPQNDLFKLIFQSRTWSTKESNSLQKAIARQCLMQR